MIKYPILLVLLSVILRGPSYGDTIARVPVKELYSKADVVAYIRITAGRVKESGYAVYEAQVIEGFKGRQAKNRIRVGKYIGFGVGLKYLAFLRHAQESADVGAETVAKEQAGLAAAPYYEILSEGMGMMDFSYRLEYCEFGVNVESGALVPKELDKATAHGWTNQKDLAAYLRSLSNAR